MAHVCPRCGALVPAGSTCPRCAPAGGGSAPDRRASQPYRSYGRAYERARQAAIEAAGGRCERCGRVAAERSGGRWRTAGLGETHHRVPLSAGGTNEPENVELLCPECHRAAHAAARGGRGAASDR